jgi:hypothetical protein
MSQKLNKFDLPLANKVIENTSSLQTLFSAVKQNEIKPVKKNTRSTVRWVKNRGAALLAKQFPFVAPVRTSKREFSIRQPSRPPKR